MTARLATSTSPALGGRPSRSPGLARRALAFVLGVLLLGSAPAALGALARASGLGEAIGKIERSGIEAGAFWYADVEKVGVAERHIASLDLVHEVPGRAGRAASR